MQCTIYCYVPIFLHFVFSNPDPDFDIQNELVSNLSEENNSWDVKSLYEFQYFNCPGCNYKHPSKQEFADHIVDNHPEYLTLKKQLQMILSVTLPIPFYMGILLQTKVANQENHF